MGKRIVIPEFRFNNKAWVVIPKQENDWYPGLIDHATIITGIGMCEELKYPRAKGKEGYKFAGRYYMECLNTIVEEYINKETNHIIPFSQWNIEEVHTKCEIIFNTKYDPFGTSIL